MIIPFQNIIFLHEFLACNGCFGLFTKIKKGSVTCFWFTFSAWFYHKSIPYLILYHCPKFQSHTFFPSQDIKQNVLLSSYLNSWWCHKDLSSIKLSRNRWQGERGEGENTKIWISRERKELFRWNKEHFHRFWRAIIWWKINISLKIVDTSFKYLENKKSF